MWGHTQYALANCMADAANPASPSHRLASEFGWQKPTLFKLYLARRSMRNGNTTLGTREVRDALNMAVHDFMAHGPASPSTSPLLLQTMAETQSLLAMAYALDQWEEAKAIGHTTPEPIPAQKPASSTSGAPITVAPDDGDLDDDDDDEWDNLTPSQHAAKRRELDNAADRYHKQIDDQVETTRAFLMKRFGEDGISGPHSMQAIAVFTVHAATLVARRRYFPKLHRGTLNGFTRSLGFRTPNPLPNVTPPPNMLVSYAGRDESFMHDNYELHEERGVGPVIRRLLDLLGKKADEDYDDLSRHVDTTADLVAKSYLPFLAKG